MSENRQKFFIVICQYQAMQLISFVDYYKTPEITS